MARKGTWGCIGQKDDSCSGQDEMASIRSHLANHNNQQCQIYELCILGIFCLGFLYCG